MKPQAKYDYLKCCIILQSKIFWIPFDLKIGFVVFFIIIHILLILTNYAAVLIIRLQETNLTTLNYNLINETFSWWKEYIQKNSQEHFVHFSEKAGNRNFV